MEDILIVPTYLGLNDFRLNVDEIIGKTFLLLYVIEKLRRNGVYKHKCGAKDTWGKTVPF